MPDDTLSSLFADSFLYLNSEIVILLLRRKDSVEEQNHDFAVSVNEVLVALAIKLNLLHAQIGDVHTTK